MKGVELPPPPQAGGIRCANLVIGSGAGGSVAARELARAGRDVLVLEEGEFVDRSEFTNGIGEMTRRLYRNGGVSPFWGRPPIGFAEGRCLGGGTVINGGLIWRTPDWILEEWRAGGLQGYGSQELRQHFETIERLLSVSLPERAANTNVDSEVLVQGSRQLGWKSVPVPRALHGCKNTNLCATGCPTGAKQSMVQTYLPEAINAGARVLVQSRVTGLSAGRQIRAAVAGPHGRFDVWADHVFLAAGPVHTPFLLRKSGLSREAGRSLQFHLNFKVLAIFPQAVHASRGTIFTDQVQEFEQQGVLFMASNFQPHYVASTLAHYGGEILREVMALQDQAGIYVAQIRPKARGKIHTFPRTHPFVTYEFGDGDLERVRFAYEKIAELLFASGATVLYPPLVGARPVRSMEEVRQQCRAIKLQDVELISVHAMSSCALGTNARDSVVDPDGKLWDHPNVHVSDASLLPSNMGESPQGTIMAFAHETIQRHLQA